MYRIITLIAIRNIQLKMYFVIQKSKIQKKNRYTYTIIFQKCYAITLCKEKYFQISQDFELMCTFKC